MLVSRSIIYIIIYIERENEREKDLKNKGHKRYLSLEKEREKDTVLK